MVADSLDIFLAVRNGASVLRTNFSDGSARAGEAALPFAVLSRVRKVHRGVFVKGAGRCIVTLVVAILVGISFAIFVGVRHWCDAEVAFHAGVTTIVTASNGSIVDAVNSICLHIGVIRESYGSLKEVYSFTSGGPLS
jgi:hypothetical protein